jgi:FAD/FMN-containing dehydrogenase
MKLLDRLDEMVARYGGRLYLAKDARMGANMFRSSYLALQNFEEIKKRHDPLDKFQSAQSKRLGMMRTL